MQNLKTLQQHSQPKSSFSKALVGWSISVLMSFGFASAAKAESPETAPTEIKEVLAAIEEAANQKDIEQVIQYYSPEFTNSDELNRSELQEALTQLWDSYPQLNYRTELKSWEAQGDEIIAETVTYITGVGNSQGREIQLETELQSRQRFEDAKIVYQDITAEKTQLTSGTNPPKVEINLPDQVRIGQRYNFDAVVTEPLGNDWLLGAALDERVNSFRFLNPTEVQLDLLPAGGIFKVGTAPVFEDNRWISAVLMRGDGMTIVTQRLRVVDPSSESKK